MMKDVEHKAGDPAPPPEPPAGWPRRTRRWCSDSWRGCAGRSCTRSKKRGQQSPTDSALRHTINEIPAPMWYPIDMDQGPSNEKKRHHFIPITYLKTLAMMKEEYSPTEKTTHKRPFTSGQRRSHSRHITILSRCRTAAETTIHLKISSAP